MASNFLIEKDGPVTTITFSRPERRNCLNLEVILEFERHLQAVRDDRECRVLIVTGQGATFCAGADTALFKGDSAIDPSPFVNGCRVLELFSIFCGERGKRGLAGGARGIRNVGVARNLY